VNAPLESSNYLFVYGSLKRGGSQHQLLGNDFKFVGLGRIADAALYQVEDYPGVIPHKGESVSGELFCLHDKLSEEQVRSIFQRLDAYEGFNRADRTNSLFYRTIVQVEADRVGSRGKVFCDAWVYFFNGSVDGKELIPSGEWKT
jgi:gamma-glutamylcyclotransferase (GGCT)/AIG2-like uncharacterized protein YtfP